MSLKTIVELADSPTTSVDTRSAGATSYSLEPRVWLKTIIDAAKKKLIATQYCYQTTLQKGQKDVVVPKRRKYIGSGAVTDGWGTAAESAAVNSIKLTNLSGVVVSPTPRSARIDISNEAIRVNALDLVKHAREELVYFAGDGVDWEIFSTLSNSTESTSTLMASQRIMGGDATQASEISAGDVITTDMIAKGKRMLMSTACMYNTLGIGEARSAESKNPWSNDPGAPFVSLIAPEQEEIFLTDSQFVNAAEYGSDRIVGNGEIGTYLGVKIVVSPNVTTYDASATHADGTTTVVAQHRCYMEKANTAAAIAYGLPPKMYVFDYPSELEKRLVLEQAFGTAIIHPDALVFMDVADS